MLVSARLPRSLVGLSRSLCVSSKVPPPPTTSEPLRVPPSSMPHDFPPQPLPPPPDELNIGDLTRARAFLGFQPRNTHQESTRYLLGTVAGHAIIDPEETLYSLRKVLQFVKKVSYSGGTFLFVSSQPQLARLTRVIGEKTGHYYLVKKWIPGLLTNWEQTRKSVRARQNVEQIAQKSGRLRQSDLLRAIDYKGIEKMVRPPDVIVRLDSTNLQGEPAAKCIPVVSVVDTSQHGREVDYPIPANANSIRFYHTLSYLLVRSIKEGAELRGDLERFRRNPLREAPPQGGGGWNDVLLDGHDMNE